MQKLEDYITLCDMCFFSMKKLIPTSIVWDLGKSLFHSMEHLMKRIDSV